MKDVVNSLNYKFQFLNKACVLHTTHTWYTLHTCGTHFTYTWYILHTLGTHHTLTHYTHNTHMVHTHTHTWYTIHTTHTWYTLYIHVMHMVHTTHTWYTPMFKLHFVSNNISLYRDIPEAIYRYAYCNSSTYNRFMYSVHILHFHLLNYSFVTCTCSFVLFKWLPTYLSIPKNM